MKKIISMILCIIMIGLSIIPAVAGVTGDFEFDSWDSVLSENDESKVRDVATTRKGDLNGDYVVSGVDARKLLRAVAGFKENIDFMQESEADMNDDGKISAVDARIILQMVAGLKTVDTVAEITMDSELVIGPLPEPIGTEYSWLFDVDKQGLLVTARYYQQTKPEAIGGSSNLYYGFVPEEKGTYTLTFKLTNIRETEVLDEFKCVLTVE